MKKLKLMMAAFALVGGGITATAQTDVTSTYLKNADFSQGTPITVGTCTYQKDAAGNGTTYSQLVAVDGWDIPENGDARAGGLIAFGSGVWIGGPGYNAPATNADGETTGNILGLVGVWTGTAQYTQNVTLPANTYTLVLGVYNSVGGTTAFTKNLIGFIEDGGTEHLASSTTYSVNTWKYEFITFTLDAETSGKVSLGYTSAHAGSGAMPHLFLSGIQLFQGEVDAAAYEAAKEAQRNAKEVALNKEKLAGASSAEPSADLLVNGSFDTANQGWTLTNMGYQNNNERPTRYVEKWQATALTGNGSAAQTIKNMPAGYYVLTGTAHTNQEETGGTKLSVNETEMEVSGTWKEYEIVYNLVSDGDIAVSFTYDNLNSNWIAIDGFSLVYTGEDFDENVYRDAKLKSRWSEAQKAAEEALANSDYANVTGDELSELQSVVAEDEPAAGGYQSAIEALTAATQAFIDAKAAYDALVIANAAIIDLPYADESLQPSPASAETAEKARTAAGEIFEALRSYYESNAKASNVTGAVDVSNLITNGVDPTNNDGWTWEGNKNNPANGEPWTDADGTNTHSYFDGGNWGANSWTTKMSQTVTLPAGKYLLTAKGRAATNTTLILSAGGSTNSMSNVGNTGNVFDRGWGDTYVEFETDGSGVTIEVSASSETLHEWFSVSDFRLMRLELYEVYADADDYVALNSAIEDAEGYTLGFENGEYAPYNNVEALQALAAAKALNQEQDNGQETVQRLTSALTSSAWTSNSGEVNAVYDGQFAETEPNATSGDITLPGWTKVDGIRLLVKDEATDPGLAYTDGGAAVFAWGGTTLTYGEQAGYTLPLAPDGVYELTLKVSGWRDGDLPSVFTVTLDGNSQTVNPSTKPINTSDGNPFESLTFYLTPTAENSVLKIYANHHFTVADLNLVKASPLSVEVAEGYATYVAGANLDFSATSIKAYTAKVDGEKVVLTEIQKVPAGTPVVLYDESGVGSEEIPFASETDTPAASDLVAGDGNSVATADGDYTNYILNNVSGIGFYKANDQTVDKGRAYLHVAGTSEARLAIVFGGATGISEVKAAANGEAVYNLSGQRVKNASKGLFIIGGKKVVVK